MTKSNPHEQTGAARIAQEHYEHGCSMLARLDAVRTALRRDEPRLGDALQEYRNALSDDARKLAAVRVLVRTQCLSLALLGTREGNS